MKTARYIRRGLDLPGRFRHCTFAGYTPRTAKQRQALAIIEAARKAGHFDEGGWLILAGPAGVGKTHLLAALHLAEAAVDELANAADYVWLDYPEAARAWANRTTHAADLQLLRGAWMLCIDDLCPPRCEAEAEALFALVAARYDEGGQGLAISTNIPPAELTRRLGDRIGDRLLDGAAVAALDGKSMRRPVSLDELRRRAAEAP